MQRGDEQRLRQPGAGLAVAAGVVVHRVLAREEALGLELADDLPAGGVALEHLPEETPPGAAHGVGPLARAGLRGIERREAGEARPEDVLEFVEGAAAQVGAGGAQRAARRAAEAAAPGGEPRGVGHRAVYIPPY